MSEDERDTWWLGDHPAADEGAAGAPYASPPAPVGARVRRPIGAALAVVLLVAGAGAGALGTHLLVRHDTAGPFTSPFGNGGAATGSTTGNGPADSAAIARHVNAGIVDITVSSGYQRFTGAGTGMVLTSTGEVLTNNHVITGATRINATDVGNGKTYAARVVGYDRTHDVAVLQLTNASGLTTVSLGDSAGLRVGASVVGVGNAGGRGGTPSYAGGTVTAVDQSITADDPIDGTAERLSGLIETNAGIVSGDSGGPLVDTAGMVIGMDTAASSAFRFSQSGHDAFAVPIDTAVSIARQIESGTATGTVHVGATAFLGVEVSSGSDGTGGSGGTGAISGGSTDGAAIASVVSGGPAATAGLTAGDVITAVDGHDVTSPEDLTSVMLGEQPGSVVPVTFRDSSGGTRTTNVRLSSGPAR